VNTGVDFAGLLYVREDSKEYVRLFTFATAQAIHLELTNSLGAP